MARGLHALGWLAAIVLVMLTGCSLQPQERPAPVDPDAARAEIARRLPKGIAAPDAWAYDIYAAFESLKIAPSAQHTCAVIAVVQQESSFQANPSVPGLAAIARREIDGRARHAHVPDLLVRAALALQSPDGRSYAARLQAAHTEKDLSDTFEDFIGSVPLGSRLFADFNPVRTGGPMQVSVAYAESHARESHYPYPLSGNIRREVFSRRGGLYFGIAHLLDYPVDYTEMLFRFADYNAGHYASRNAAFQNAVTILSGTKLALDGDLLRYAGSSDEPSQTELALRKIGSRLQMSEAEIHHDLKLGEAEKFGRSHLYAQVFELAERGRKPLPRALLPRIKLESAKITRQLSTAWFAQRVNNRYTQCLSH